MPGLQSPGGHSQHHRLRIPSIAKRRQGKTSRRGVKERRQERFSLTLFLDVFPRRLIVSPLPKPKSLHPPTPPPGESEPPSRGCSDQKWRRRGRETECPRARGY